MSANALRDLICPMFDESVLVKILKKSTGLHDVRVNEVKVKDSATNKGDSYLSTIVRFTIEGTVKDDDWRSTNVTCPVLVKTLPKNIARQKSFRSTDFFRNEVIFYNDVWDTMLLFQETRGVRNKFTNIPRCFAAMSDGKNDYIALEDLTAQSYVPFKRQNQMDYENIVMIIRLFARFHALSFALKDRIPEIFQNLVDKIEETYFDEKYRNWYAKFHGMLINCSRDAIEQELAPSYLEKFDELIASDLYGKVVKIAQNKNSKCAVITEGDAWIPNFLCKYNAEGKPEDMKLIDFQLARFCSLTCDISFFLYACASYTLLCERWDDILAEYHRTFAENLAILRCDPTLLSLEDIKADMKENALLGAAMAMEAMPFQLMDDSEAADLDSMKGDEALDITTVFIVTPIKTKEGRQQLANVWKHAIDNEFV
ncbi:uncharacterized protein CBL_20578 [Carabus blaptoides fortunei]